MSSDADEDVIGAIGHTIMRWQDARQDFDEAFGRIHGLSSPECRCLGLIAFAPQTARAIADETGLTPGSITALLDRLEARGLLSRKPDPNDRRKVMIWPTHRMQVMVDEAYGPIHREGVSLLEGYSPDERAIVLKFVTDALNLQTRINADFLDR
ncbi:MULTISPECIES: MarR family winged helix-turn-helix transcriptional regulator [unclassified Rhizobium]|uniref:MarR family winged helix-turn-helix transcriptional regulator n=1 Tax=unclassified Rhizobium TaxID=2613769 RepID=UPI00247AC4F7|nr:MULTISPECIES: MarR family transcriptional regulator [unclassified Rhizobium]MDH7804786.1 DNA-binding MarR family transcriptional regulator [Rhizobium sp. AN70]